MSENVLNKIPKKINIYDVDEYSSCEYNIENKEAYFHKRFLQNNLRMVNRLNYYFKWKSEANEGLEEVKIPKNLEIVLRFTGLMGFHKEDKLFLICNVIQFDELNEANKINGISLGTENPKSYADLTKDDVILLYNNPLGVSDLPEINFMSYEKGQTDISRMYQLINSRLIPLLSTDSDKAFKAIVDMLNDVKAGKPGVITTNIIDEVKKLDFLDPSAIGKMECLTGYDEILDKHIANRWGASLDIKNKAAQVNNPELHAYDDLTTADYLANYEPRIEFCEKMKEAGFSIECVPNPIFADEPTIEEIENPELIEENDIETGENDKNLQKTDLKSENDTMKEGGEDNEN